MIDSRDGSVLSDTQKQILGMARLMYDVEHFVHKPKGEPHHIVLIIDTRECDLFSSVKIEIDHAGVNLTFPLEQNTIEPTPESIRANVDTLVGHLREVSKM